MSEVSPTDELKLRVQFDTRYDFHVEQGAIDEHDDVGRKAIREAIDDLSHTERKALEHRVKQRLERVDELMAGDQKTFDEPLVEHEDLVKGCRIPGFYD